MAKTMTKAQAKRLLRAIDSKSKKLWSPMTTNRVAGTYMSTKDMIAIEKIVAKNLKRLG